MRACWASACRLQPGSRTERATARPTGRWEGKGPPAVQVALLQHRPHPRCMARPRTIGSTAGCRKSGGGCTSRASRGKCSRATARLHGPRPVLRCSLPRLFPSQEGLQKDHRVRQHGPPQRSVGPRMCMVRPCRSVTAKTGAGARDRDGAQGLQQWRGVQGVRGILMLARPRLLQQAAARQLVHCCRRERDPTRPGERTTTATRWC